MFRDREDAGQQLAARLKGQSFRNPLVLAIPRGGVVIGSVLARELDAELDVVLARKLRAPGQPELAIGAIDESGEVFLNEYAEQTSHLTEEFLESERKFQLAEIVRRKALFREVRPPATITGRSVIVTDDGIATGSTMLAGLRTIQGQDPCEVIVAVPVAAADRLDEFRPLAHEIICLYCPESFWAIGQFYEDFTQVSDEEVTALL